MYDVLRPRLGDGVTARLHNLGTSYSFTRLFTESVPAKRLAPALLKVDRTVWRRTSLGDGSFAYTAECPHCGRRVMTGYQRVMPAAHRCACLRWLRLP